MTSMLPARTRAVPPLDAGPLGWTSRWETSLAPDDHEAIAALLARTYPSSAAVFSPERSWAGARPELRVLARRDDEIVAHAATVRRFLRTADGPVLVGDVGLVAVHPGRQGTGLGAALMRTVAAALTELALPYGFLTCDPHVRPFYRRCGWSPLDARVRSIRVDGAVEERRHGMVLPVRRPFPDWPAGSITRDGQEI